MRSNNPLKRKLRTPTPPPTSPTADTTVPQASTSPMSKKPSKRTEGTNIFEELHDKWELCNQQFKNVTIADWFQKRNADTALFLFHIFPTKYKEATLRLKLQKVPLPNPAHSPYAHLFNDKSYTTILQGTLKAKAAIQKKHTWERLRSYLPLPSPSSSSAPGPSTTPAPLMRSHAVIFPSALPQLSQPRAPLEVQPSSPTRSPSLLPFNPLPLPESPRPPSLLQHALSPLLWSQEHRREHSLMELYIKPNPVVTNEPDLNDPMEDAPQPHIEPIPEPDPDSPIKDTPPPAKSPPPPKPEEWKPYEPTGGKYGTMYALEHGEQLTEPWKQFHEEAGPSTVEKRPVSPTSKVSTPKHFVGSERQTILSTPVYVTPAPSLPPTPNLSNLPTAPDSTQQHTVALPFGYIPTLGLPEPPDI